MLVRQSRAPLSAQTAVAVILFGVIAVIACIAAAAWVLFDHPAAVSTCTLIAPALPVQTPARRLWRRWRLWLNRRRMAETELQIAQYQRLLVADSVRLEQLRDQLAGQQRLQLDLASQP